MSMKIEDKLFLDRFKVGEESHLRIVDGEKCTKECQDQPCLYFCPAEVYKLEGDEIALSPSNCVHCQTCRTKSPHQTIQWRVPEGGDGPKYKIM